ncbi:OmpH family outer membrane protein [Balneola sp. MJW-20]|uniref:OmpH family outer membrane protein n=1 Tax=Gracilimonas aurantiaca TaxID=3234185 RepID=UPI003466A7B2
MKRLSTLLLTALFGILLLNHASAQETLTIGYVNPQAVLAKMPETQAIQQQLRNLSEKKEAELRSMSDSFQNELTRFEQRSSVITEDARRNEEERLAQMEQDLVQAQQNAQAEVQQKRQELLGPLFQQIGDAIDAVAARKGLSYVLNTTTSNGDLIILYASEEFQQKYDITMAVMEELGVY